MHTGHYHLLPPELLPLHMLAKTTLVQTLPVHIATARTQTQLLCQPFMAKADSWRLVLLHGVARPHAAPKHWLATDIQLLCGQSTHSYRTFP
jgi:hypothetical protein